MSYDEEETLSDSGFSPKEGDLDEPLFDEPLKENDDSGFDEEEPEVI